LIVWRGVVVTVLMVRRSGDVSNSFHDPGAGAKVGLPVEFDQCPHYEFLVLGCQLPKPKLRIVL